MPVTRLSSTWKSGNLHFRGKLGLGSTDAAWTAGHINLGDVDSTAVLFGAGTSTTRITTATANKRFFNFNVENTATSGDNRGMYLRLYLGGAGGGGESLRAFTTVNNVAAGTAHGAHLSLNFAATGSITGLGAASRSTLHIPDAALSGGTYAGGMSEIYADGSSSDISGATKHSIHRFVVDGDATGKDTLQAVWELVGMKTGTGATDPWKTTAPGTIDAAIRIFGPDGNPYWVNVSSAAS
jgi:hypothetical protein